MTFMLVRCGQCRAELEVAGAGEFLCPHCGTRNAVRGATQDRFTIPTAPKTPAAAVDDVNLSVQWLVCSQCSYRFAAGRDLEEVSCPNCSAALSSGEPRSGAVS